MLCAWTSGHKVADGALTDLGADAEHQQSEAGVALHVARHVCGSAVTLLKTVSAHTPVATHAGLKARGWFWLEVGSRP